MTCNSIIDAILKGNESDVQKEIKEILYQGVEAGTILRKGLIQAMNIVGERWKLRDIFLPEVIMCAQCMHVGIDILKPLLVDSNQESIGKIVIGTVKGDIHDIGKKVVSYLLEGNGFEVIDLGVDVPETTFIKAAIKHTPDVLGLSALLTTTMPHMESVIQLLQKEGLRNNVKVIIGGAAVNASFADSIGADGFAPEATSAVELFKKAVIKQIKEYENEI